MVARFNEALEPLRIVCRFTDGEDTRGGLTELKEITYGPKVWNEGVKEPEVTRFTNVVVLIVSHATKEAQ